MAPHSQIRPGTASLRTLLVGLIDYAGLFPPAAQSMPEAIQHYAAYLDSEYYWALGRFIVPASRLDEFSSAFDAANISEPWSLSAIVGDPAKDLEAILAFNSRSDSLARIDSIECRVASAAEVSQFRNAIPPEIMLYCEVPPTSSIELLTAIALAGARAKVRTGGVTAEAFPAASDLASFVVNCASAGVAFKATAGLHHPVRCQKPLTYEPNAPTGNMYGFLNVFLAAMIAGTALGKDVEAASRELILRALPSVFLNENASSFEFEDSSARVRAQVKATLPNERDMEFEFEISTERIAQARQRFAISFGSCSFVEPIEDLRSLGLL